MSIEQYREIAKTLKDGFEQAFPEIEPREIDFQYKGVLTVEQMAAHAKSMFPPILEWIAKKPDPGSECFDKFLKWMAFTQGYAHACGIFSINDLRRMNTPPDRPFVEK